MASYILSSYSIAKDEQQAIFKVIDLAISNKKLKDNLSQLIAQ